MPDITRFDNAAGADITEAGNLALFILRDRAIAAAEQDLRLNPDRAQFFDRVLSRFGFHFAGHHA